MLYIIMCRENCADDANVNNMVETLLREIQGLRSELNDLRTGLEASKIKLVPDAIYNNKEIRLLKKGISLRNVSKLTGTSVNTLRKCKALLG